MVTAIWIDMRVTPNIFGIAGLMALLSACAGGGDGRYPSLALRPFETAVTTAPDPAPVAPIRPVASDAAIAALVDRANAAHQVFIDQQREAAGLAQAAAGQSVESNVRARALVAMAGLSSQRGATSAVLADLDLLVAEAATTFAPAPAITSARAQVATLVEREDVMIAQLWQAMGS